MYRRLISGLIITLAFLAASTEVGGQTKVASIQVAKAKSTIIGRGPNHRVWRTERSVTLPNGEASSHIGFYTEMAPGMHYRVDGEWLESQDLIEITVDGAIAQKGQHKVRFAANLNTAGAIQLRTSEGRDLVSHIIGLSYFDVESGNSVLIAQIKDCSGELVEINQLLYRNAFSGVTADVRYTYTMGGFEQDVILRSAPPAPDRFGLNPKTTRLEVLTEYINPPQPSTTTVTLKQQDSEITAGKRLSFTDDLIDFGTMQMGPGKAFPLGDPAAGGNPGQINKAPVGKSWQQMDGRDFLIEGVEYETVAAELQKLKTAAVGSESDKVKTLAASPVRNLPQLSRTKRTASLPIKPANLTAAIASHEDKTGFVLDYSMVTTVSNCTFQGDTTYLLTSNVTFTGTTVIEGGTVIKHTDGNWMLFHGPVSCLTEPYRPAVFTDLNDDSFGEPISGSTGSPVVSSADILDFHANYFTNSVALKNLRMLYGYTAVYLSLGSGHSLENIQIVNSKRGVTLDTTDVVIRNALVVDAPDGVILFANTTPTYARVEQLTAHRAGTLCWSVSGTNVLAVTNSLLVAVTNLTLQGYIYPVTVESNQVYWLTNDPGTIFQTVGAGAHYLADSTYRSIGSSNINPNLSASLRAKTTYPPLVYSNVAWTTNVTLTRRSIRDTNNSPDIGYHYESLDYVLGGVDTSTNLTLSSGVAVGWFDSQYATGYGLRLLDGATVNSQGSANTNNYFVRFSTVQEMNNSAWYQWGWVGAVTAGGSGANPYPTFNSSFTRFSTLAAEKNHLRGSDGYMTFRGTDCQFFCGNLYTTASRYCFTNNLFWRVYTYLQDYYGAGFTNFNATYYGGIFGLDRFSGGTWTINDCLFDGTSITISGGSGTSVFDYNGFTDGTGHSSLTNVHDVSITNLIWQAGPLGNYYLPTNLSVNGTPLDKGSLTNAGLRGLYHYTTTTNNFKETNSVLDMGFHYVAVATNGLAIDTDGDGLPDYVEDRNGNGTVDPTETSYLTLDTDYDGRTDAQELTDATDPLNSDSVSQVRLGYWRFNTTNNLSEAGLPPLSSINVTNFSSWSGTAVQLVGSSAQLLYREVETNSSANFNCHRGTVRFWFKPNWSSTNIGGAGPGATNVPLLELGTVGNTNGWWSIHLDAAGQLKLGQATNGSSLNQIISTNVWLSNLWQQVTVTYASNAIVAYVNGRPVSTNSGITYYPSAAGRSQGFAVGSHLDGSQPVNAQFEELECFNYQLPADEIQDNYNVSGRRPVAPTFIAGSVDTNRQFTLTLAGDPGGATWSVEATTNFSSWTALGTIVMTNTNVTFLDTQASNFIYRFYRATNGCVRSGNIYGFVGVTCSNGNTLLANQLINSNATVTNLFSGAPTGAYLFKWNETNQVYYAYTTNTGSSWSDNSVTLNPGEAAFLYNPNTNSWRVTFTGEVPEGKLSNRLPAATAARSSLFVQPGLLATALSLPTATNLSITVWKYNGTGLVPYTYDPDFASWDVEPTVGVGEGFLVNYNISTNWIQTQLQPSTWDTDGDTLYDCWESQYFGSLSQTPWGDYDSDGLLNFMEQKLETSPASGDADNDGLPDLWEYQNSMFPALNEAANQGYWLQYQYDAAGKLKKVPTMQRKDITYDAEGNIQSVTP